MMSCSSSTPVRDTRGDRRDETATRLVDRFETPTGFVRVRATDGSFGQFLRHLRLRTDRNYVVSYQGTRMRSPAAAVARLDVGRRDVQQCADSLIRLHAEWLWHQSRAEEVACHFTSGDESSWRGWRAGERFLVTGAHVRRVMSGKVDASYGGFKRYLFHTFRYASTRSMHLDSRRIPITSARGGDFFVQPGSPGHAVMVLDVSRHKDGRRAVLLGQGAMPAQEFHVIERNHREVLDGVWFVLPKSDRGHVETPSWKPFAATELRRFTTL